MQKSAFIIFIFLFLGCGTTRKHQGKTFEQSSLDVDARVRVYKTDGSVYYKEYQPFKTRTVTFLPGFKSSDKSFGFSKYGGDKKSQTHATGFFHVKKMGARWWAVDPEGYLYFNIALNSISPGKSENNLKAFNDKFGTRENWMKSTIQFIQENGFNCAGSWSDTEAIREANKTLDKPLPYCINWNFMSSYGKQRGGTFQKPGHTGYPNNAIFVFDPEFETFCNQHALKLAETKDDPNLFGHFSDNEMPFPNKSLDNFLALPQNEPGYKAATNWLT